MTSILTNVLQIHASMGERRSRESHLDTLSLFSFYRGTCVDDVNGYRCVCPKGTSLPNCVDTTDDCATGPCYNGAQCLDRVDSVECTCTKGKQKKVD